MFVEKRFWTTNITQDNKYYGVKGKICNFLNTFLHGTLFSLPSIILIAFYLHAKNRGTFRVSPEYNSVTHSWVKKSMIDYL